MLLHHVKMEALVQILETSEVANAQLAGLGTVAKLVRVQKMFLIIYVIVGHASFNNYMY